MRRRLHFWWLYFRNKGRWNTGIVPPEVVRLADRLTPARALDLGCGTGVSSVFLAQHGWLVTGIDFIPSAIRRARQHAQQAGVRVDFRVGDVTRLDTLTARYNLILDIGCFHSLSEVQRTAYVLTVTRLAAPGCVLALYAHFPRLLNGEMIGITPDDVAQRFAPGFAVEATEPGDDGGRPSAWYTLRNIR
jgi:2-polyprenyl-3-methyl-5-hydroxy-6-metoxy-1,4-benzoquinol methylase